MIFDDNNLTCGLIKTSKNSLKMISFNNKIVLSAILVSALLSPSCEDFNHNCASTICTEVFKAVVVNIKHASDNSPYVLSNYSVIRVSDNVDVTPTADSDFTSQGYYPIANDSKKELYKFKNITVEFRGYLNGNLVIQRQFIITADCCHISLVQGETSISL